MPELEWKGFQCEGIVINMKGIAFGLLLLCAPSIGSAKTAKIFETVEWTFTNPSISGNPYDLISTATFTHPTACDIVTELYFNGGQRWKLRFTPTAVGEWNFTTSSPDPDLDGLTDTVTVSEDPDAPGFITKLGDGSRWGRSGTKQTFVPQLTMFPTVDLVEQDPTIVDERIEIFLGDHGFNGFHIPMLCRWFDINETVCGNRGNSADPDRRTFEALELVIQKTYADGGVVHFWMWGDEQKQQTPIRWGINGSVDRRLQRYIAARLGPLPGWSMGYGFDLDEWVGESELEVWRNFVHSRLGWFHFLGGRPAGPNSGSDHSEFVTWNEPLDYSSYEHHKPTYDLYRAALNTVPGQPVMSEDRFRIRNEGRSKDYDQTETRRGL